MIIKKIIFSIIIFFGLLFPIVAFGTTLQKVSVTDSGLSSYIFSEQFGWIHLAPTPGASTTWTGVHNDGAGNLSGYAFGISTSWINFNPASSTSASFVPHGVKINPTDGAFSGWAWVQNVGWMLFDCSRTDGISSPCVKTNWFPGHAGEIDSVDRISWLCTPESGNTDCHDHTRVNWNISASASTSTTDNGGGGGGGGITIYAPTAIPNPSSGPFSGTQSVILLSINSININYTTNGDVPDCSASSTTYSGAITVATSQTIKAIGCNGSYSSPVSTFDYVIGPPIAVSAPIATPPPGTYTATTTVSLSSVNSTSILYTNDGNDPVCPSVSSPGYGTTYSSNIVISFSETIKAIGCNGTNFSPVSTFNYIINSILIPPIVYPPQASLPPGTYTETQSVGLSSTNSKKIYYTTNGDTPDCSGMYDEYKSQILITTSETLKAIGCNGTNFSTVSVFDYVINTASNQTTTTTTGTTTIIDIVNKTFGTIATTTTKVINSTNDQIKKVSLFAEKIFTSPENVAKIQAVTTVGIVAGSAIPVVSGIVLSSFSFSDFLLILLRLWSLFLGFLGITKKKKPWGTVYDSVTKQPLDPVYVVLRSIEGKDISTAITDLDGRYGFVVPEPGNYSIIVNKTNYQFPSQNLVGHDHDELYRDLYFGEHFPIAQSGEIIAKNIPMDPEKFDWNEFAKKSQHLMKFYSIREKWLTRISGFFFAIGFIVSSLAVLFLITKWNVIIFLLYVVLFFVRVFGLRSRPYGSIISSNTGEPIAFAIIRISHVTTGVELMHRITDALGRYYCLLPNGEYFVRVDQKLSDGTYNKVAEKVLVNVTKGYLSEKISVLNTPIDIVPIQISKAPDETKISEEKPIENTPVAEKVNTDITNKDEPISSDSGEYGE